MIFYVFLSYGPRHGRTLREHPAAKQQLANLRYFADLRGLGSRPVVFDYARRVSDIHDLPELKRALERASGRANAVVIDDLRRIFARCPEMEARRTLLRDLSAFGESLLTLGYGMNPMEFRQLQTEDLLHARPPISFVLQPTQRAPRSKNELKAQTRRANLVSGRRRRDAANEKARELDAIRREIAKDTDRPTLKRIAEEANRRGVLTTRGNPWSAPAVKRALDRLDDDTSSKPMLERARRRRLQREGAPSATTGRDPE